MFKPGKVIKTFKSKSGKEIVLRYAKWEDLDSLLMLINEISKEDTFISVGNKEIKREEEIDFLTDIFKKSEKGDKSHICAFHKSEIVGSCSVDRNTHGNRSRHVGRVGIIIRKPYRDDGIGKEMLKTIIEEGKKMHLKLIHLGVYAINERAKSLYEKIGFKHYGTLPKSIEYKGKLIDHDLMYMEI